MTGYEWVIMLLAFSIILNACYIGLRVYDHLADRAERRSAQRHLDKMRHPSHRVTHPVHLDEWRRSKRDTP